MIMKGVFKKNFRTEKVNKVDEIPNIFAVGVGNSGNNMISKLAETGILNVNKIAVDTNKKHLLSVNADKKVLVGRILTKGLGPGGYPITGRRAAESARSTFEDLLCFADIVFIFAGINDTLGPGAAAVIAEAAKKKGAIVIAVIKISFSGKKFHVHESEITELATTVNSIIIFDENLYPFLDDPERIIAESVGKISSVLIHQSLMNFDLRELKSILCNSRYALLIVERLRISDSLDEKIRRCFDNLDRYNCKKISGVLVHITGGERLTLHVAEKIIENIRDELKVDNITCGASVDENLEDEIILTSILAGLNFDETVEINDLFIAKRIPFSIVEEWEDYLKTEFGYKVARNIISMILSRPYILDEISLKKEDIIRDIELSIEDINFGGGNNGNIKERMIKIAKKIIEERSFPDYFI